MLILHAAAPAWSWYVLTGHAVHALASANRIAPPYVPAGQALQLEIVSAPGWSPYRPWAQAAQYTALSAPTALL